VSIPTRGAVHGGVRSTRIDPYAVNAYRIPIFTWLYRIAGLAAQHRELYGLLASYRGKAKRECTVSLGRLARELGIEERSVQRHLRVLVQASLIEVEARSGTSNRYHFLRHAAQETSDSDVTLDSNDVSGPDTSVVRPVTDSSREERQPCPASISSSNSSSISREESPSAELSMDEKIAALEGDYSNHTVVLGARVACGIGLEGDAAQCRWLHVLAALHQYENAAAEYAMTEMVEKHADGGKDSNYMLAIVRREHSRIQTGKANGTVIPIQHSRNARKPVGAAYRELKL
jgi:DNA-binding transcriptional ArsR family regulator